MLSVPLDRYRHRRPDGRTLDFAVELDDEGGIAVSIDVDPRELTSSHRRPSAELEKLLEKWTDDGKIVPTAELSKRDRTLLLEVLRLREELDSRVDSIDLHPEPGEARAIAAALVHHADEVDRLFGRRI